MKKSVWLFAFLFALALLSGGCARRRYQPAPIQPAPAAAAFEQRTLDVPALKEFIKTNLRRDPEPWPPPAWDLELLTLAAFYYHPDLDVARARLGVAEAEAITAGARPNPSIRVIAGAGNIPENPWLFGLELALPIETAGKRGLRLERARLLTDAARLQLGETAWQVRDRVRAALLDHALAVRRVELLEHQRTLRSQMVALLQKRLQVGEISRSELQPARLEMATTATDFSIAEKQINSSRAALAQAVGVPVLSLETVRITVPLLDVPPAVASLNYGEIQRAAVLNRIDLRRSLAEYAAADAALKLEIAKQYPNLELAPGYDFEEGAHRFVLGVSIPLPIFNRNEGPIAEAEARRKEAAAHFLALQARIITETGKALALYGAALKRLDTASAAVLQVQSESERLARVSFSAGESDRVELTQILARGLEAARMRLEALQEANTAFMELENAVQRPLGSTPALPDIPLTHPRTEPPRVKP